MSNRMNNLSIAAILACGVAVGMIADNLLDSQKQAEAQAPRPSLASLDSRLTSLESNVASLGTDVSTLETVVAAIPAYTDSRYLQLSGGTLTGDLSIGGDVFALGTIRGQVQIPASAAAGAADASTAGRLRYDSASRQLEISDGTQWKQVGIRYNAGTGLILNPATNTFSVAP